ncbi:hypothetical protein BVM15_14185 [Listeria monocytogenes]|nr:hypothetical protein [Listeria monocytogenes]
MAFENLELIVTAVGGKIYLSTLNKDGYMSIARKEMTEDVLRVAMEYFMTNQLKQHNSQCRKMERFLLCFSQIIPKQQKIF